MTKVMTKGESSTNDQTVMVSNRGEGFNRKKNELKAFSEKLPKEAELPSVPVTGGLFGWFNYDVTGSDLNRLTESIQDKMIEQNKVLVKTIQEFNTIYDTFSALDKEYIQGILVSLKAAEEANAKALKGIEGVEVNQNEIEQMINQQKKVIQVLQSFKEKIERIEHLTDVDTIFAIYSTMQENVTAIEAKIEAQDQTVADLTVETKSLLSSQSDFQDHLNQLNENQLKQFQTVNQLVSHQNNNISKIETINTENKTDIETLNKEVVKQGGEFTDLKQLLQDDIQTLSEKIVRNHSEIEAKLDLTTNEISKNKTNLENAIKELNVGIEQQAERMDKIFAIYSTMQENVTAIEAKIEAQDQTVADLTVETKSLLSSQLDFQNYLNQLKENQLKQFQTVNQLKSHQNNNISKIETINTENKTDIDTLNKEVAKQGEKFGDLKQLLHDDIQTLSEKSLRNHSEIDAKLDLTTNEVSKNKTDLENAIKELNVGNEQQAERMSSYFEAELSKAKDEITELNQLTVNLSKGLKTTRVFSFASIALTCVLVLLMLSGVL